MKVFISWSGELSHKVACALRDWLPGVMQNVTPYVSSDIDKGIRWNMNIARELESSCCGILCLTADNVQAPWINFEAGALSRTVDKSRVVPLLVNLEQSEIDPDSPLVQFQSTRYEQEEVQKLLISMNNLSDPEERLDEALLERVFAKWWPDLSQSVDQIIDSEPCATSASRQPAGRVDNAVLEQLLELARSQQRILGSPDVLLPERYLQQVLRKVVDGPREINPEFKFAVSEISRAFEALIEFTQNTDLASNTARSSLFELLATMGGPILGLEADLGLRKPGARLASEAIRLGASRIAPDLAGATMGDLQHSKGLFEPTKST